MDDNLSLMNKKQSDLTVADVAKINVGALAIIAGGFAAIVVVTAVSQKAAEKVRAMKTNRQIKKDLTAK